MFDHGRLGSHHFPGSPAAAVQRMQVLLTLGGSAAPAAPLPMALCSPNLAQLGSALESYSWAGGNAWWPLPAGHLLCHLSTRECAAGAHELAHLSPSGDPGQP